ncbi:putative ferric-chelate reductase ASCRUDRAFT_39967 [Ascoidea rubescens DSM 1968]|uniref:Ferric oxidoreductase domain-containing protein n=1 Tax=Ascoidea rubescens DSM 1968 TaxID=1344418 RepID=A0A1D2V9A0_9ASCO|nr:hypothetical protein ASCRUDRAFT_39967 [Ascoidea rubescens DSM 1968]ODV58097.1 hypothetical protein ASCRUDRAFT_39967 [Ascoidea rubescens DSM 1968]
MDELHTDSFSLLPHYDYIYKTDPVYKKFRKLITKNYGLASLFGSLFIIIFLYPLWNHLIFKYSPKFKSLKKLFKYKLFNIIFFWSLFSLLLCFPQTYNDMSFLTKRFGRVSASLLPTLLFLSIRPSPLPETLYLALLPIHKWLGRIIVLLAIFHTHTYCALYFHLNKFNKIYKLENLYGWFALLGFLSITLSSLPIIRRKYFKFFYINHYIWTWIIVVLINLHSRPSANLLTFLNIAILTYQIYHRLIHSIKVNIQSFNLSSNLKIVKIYKDDQNLSNFFQSNLPGSHLRMMRYYKNPFKNLFFRFITPLAHPYTIASLPTDNSIILIIRNSKFELNNNYQYYITGSYDPDFHFLKYTDNNNNNKFIDKISNKLSRSNQNNKNNKNQRYKNIISFCENYESSASRVLMVVGGSGISFALPLLRVLSIKGIECKIIYVIKDVKDLRIFRFFNLIDLNSIEVYITGKNFQETDFSKLNIDDFDDDQPDKDFNHLENQEQISYLSGSLTGVDFNNYGSINDLETNNDYQEFDYTFFEPNTTATATTANNNTNIANKNWNLKSPRLNKEIHENSITSSIAESPSSSMLRRIISIDEQDSEVGMKMMDIMKRLKIYKGRPVLGEQEYNWCIETTCTGPIFNSNGTICCREAINNDENNVKLNKFENCWVIGVGPPGLVEKTKVWARDCGFQFHEESFSV